MFLFAGVHLLRPGCPQGRLRDDLFRRRKRRMFVAVRFDNEVHRSSASDGARCDSSRGSDRCPPRVEAASGKRVRLLHGLRPLGSR